MSLGELVGFFRDYVGLGPGIVVSLVAGLMLCGYVGRLLGISKVHGWVLVMSVGVVLSATITPSREALMSGAQGSGTCDFSRIGLASWWELRHLDDASLNVLLLAPLGIAIGLCPRSRAKLGVVAASLALPIGIELIQLAVVSLGRACQSSDVVDNLSGLVLGLLIGSVVGRTWPIRPDASDR